MIINSNNIFQSSLIILSFMMLFIFNIINSDSIIVFLFKIANRLFSRVECITIRFVVNGKMFLSTI